MSTPDLASAILATLTEAFGSERGQMIFGAYRLAESHAVLAQRQRGSPDIDEPTALQVIAERGDDLVEINAPDRHGFGALRVGACSTEAVNETG